MSGGRRLARVGWCSGEALAVGWGGKRFSVWKEARGPGEVGSCWKASGHASLLVLGRGPRHHPARVAVPLGSDEAPVPSHGPSSAPASRCPSDPSAACPAWLGRLGPLGDPV